MSAEEIRITLRMPAELRDQVKRHAEANNRSMNNEILSLLEVALFEADMARMETGREPLREMRPIDREIVEAGKLRMKAIEERKAREASGVPESVVEPYEVPFFEDEEAARAFGKDPRKSTPTVSVELLKEMMEELKKLSDEREADRQQAAQIIKEQRDFIWKLHRSEKSSTDALTALRTVFRKAADGDDAPLQKVIAAVNAIEDDDEDAQP